MQWPMNHDRRMDSQDTPDSAASSNKASPERDTSRKSGANSNSGARVRDPERREKILEVAVELIASKGYQAVSLDDIGSAAGIVGSGVYRHFNTKVDILVQILDRVVDRLVRDAEAILRQTDDPGTALTALVRGHIDFTLMERELCVVYVGELRSLPRTDRHRLRWKQRHYVDLWIDLLRMARPELTPEQAQVRVHATISSIHSVLLYHSPLDQPGLTDEMVMVSGDVLGLPRTSPVTSG